MAGGFRLRDLFSHVWVLVEHSAKLTPQAPRSQLARRGACNLVCEYSQSIQKELRLPLVERRTKDFVDWKHKAL